MKTVPLIGIARHRLSIDGEGVTTLVAFHGCPLHCKYCLNPTCLQPDGIWKNYDCNQLYEEVRKDELYFLTSRGGVTLAVVSHCCKASLSGNSVSFADRNGELPSRPLSMFRRKI